MAEIDKDGYLCVPCATGTRRNGKMILEHRLVVETHIGRKLLTTEIIHHINGDKLDNRIENLKVLSRREHIIEHAYSQQTCPICQTEFTAWGRGKYCSTVCYNRAGYLSRASRGYFKNRFAEEKLAEKRECKTCGCSLGLAHRNRDYCSNKCDPWH